MTFLRLRFFLLFVLSLLYLLVSYQLSFRFYYSNGSAPNEDSLFRASRPTKQLEQHAIYFVHIGKSGGETIKSVLAMGCLSRQNLKRRQECYQKLVTTALSRQVRGYVHCLQASPGSLPLPQATAFLYNLRHPLDRWISWYHYIHPNNCIVDTPRMPCLARNTTRDHPHGWLAHFYQCAPTLSSVLRYIHQDNNNITTTCLPVHQALQGTVNLTDVPLASHAVANLRLNWAATQTYVQQQARVLVVRTEYLWKDLRELDVFLGGTGEFGGGVKNITHRAAAVGTAPTYESVAPAQAQPFCCALLPELQLYRYLLQRADNIKSIVKQSTIQDAVQRCGFTSWAEMERVCDSGAWTKEQVRQPETHFNPPKWFQDYLNWHARERTTLTADNWQSKRHIIMRCLDYDGKCGGTSDRLMGIPFYILVAHQMKRLLFIHWERPAPLEEFLVPPRNGLDWRLPFNYTFRDRPHIITTPKVLDYLDSNETVIEMRHQSLDYGREYFNQHEPNFDTVYRSIWDRVFEPSPAVQAALQAQLAQLDLQPGNYTALHIRSMYLNDKAHHIRHIKNAVQCAATFNASIYVATDNVNATRAALMHGKQHGYTIKSAAHKHEPLHLDRGSKFLSKLLRNTDWNQYKPHAYYNVFVDLLLLAQAKCVSYGVGGFGKWAAILAGATCTINHAKHECSA